MEKTPKGIRALFTQRTYLIILGANSISRFGDAIDSIAYAWMVYTLTGSKLLMGSLLAVNALPNLLFSAFSGVVADYFPKKNTIVLGHIGRGILVSITALLYMNGMLESWHLFVLAFLTSTIETFSSPAHGALIPHIVDKELFPEATGFSGSTSMAISLAGMGSAGVLIALTGVGGVILIDGVTFFLAAAITASVRVPTDKKAEGSLTATRWWADLKEGFAFMASSRILMVMIFLAMFVNFAIAPLNVLEPAYVKEILRAGPEALSLIGSALVIGMILGGLLAGNATRKFGTWNTAFGGFVAIGLGYALIGLPGLASLPGSPVAFAGLFYFLTGLAVPFVNTPLQAWFMGNVPREKMGRTMAVMNALCMCANPLGSAFSGAAAEAFSIPVLFVSLGSLIALIVIPSAIIVGNDKKKEGNRDTAAERIPDAMEKQAVS